MDFFNKVGILETSYDYHNTQFYFQITNGPMKLERFNALGYKGLPGTNTTAYRVHS